MKRKLGYFLIFVVAVALATYISTGMISQWGSNAENKTPTAEQVKTTLPVATPVAPASIATIAERVLPSVVGISTAKAEEKTGQGSIFNELYTNRPVWSIGSGVIVSSKGYILTNRHVLGQNPLTVEVILADGTRITGKAVWSDPTLDLAIVRVDYNNLKSAQIGDAEQLKVGEQAVAIGNPLGLNFSRTVTAGIISALGRSVEVETEEGKNFMEGLIQTDASINPGNSGGPLIDESGLVVGINTIKVEAAEGVGFAVPVNYVRPVIEAFETNGRYDTPYLGFYAFEEQKGLRVAGVDPDGPVYQAGIRENDIITGIADEKITTMYQLRKIIYTLSAGENTNINFITGLVEKSTIVTPVLKKNSNSINR